MFFDEKLMNAVSFGKTEMISEKNGYAFSRFTKEQKQVWSKKSPYFPEESMDGYFFGNCTTDANIKLDFTTDSSFVKISIADIELTNGLKEDFTYVFINGRKSAVISEHSECCLNLKGKSRVQLFFPSYSHIHIKGIEIDDNGEVVPARHSLHWLCHGDSITQGAGASAPYFSYVSRIANKYNIEVINQANSGYINDENVITKVDGWEPDIVTSAYGTNDVGRKTIDEFRKDLYAVCRKLKEQYPKSKIFVISPVWSAPLYEDIRYSVKRPDVYKAFDEVGEMDGITLIDGLKLIPNSRRYFLPDGTHPTDTGHAYYATRLGKILFENTSNR